MNLFARNTKSSLKLTTAAMVVVLAQGVMLTGCSTPGALMVKQVEQHSSDQQQVQKLMEALQITESRVAKAQASNVDLYAPRELEKAKQALTEARRYYERFQAEPHRVNDSISMFFSDTLGSKTLELITEADLALSQAEETKRQADVIFASTDENFAWLKKFQAQLYFPREYQHLERSQQRLIDSVTRGRMDAVRDRLPGLQQEQKALEIAAAQRFYLYEISRRVEREDRYTMDRYAPLSLTASLGALTKAKAVIAQDTRNEKAILEAKAEAEFAFDVAQAVSADMQKLVDMDRREMERWLMLLTERLRSVGHSMGAEDVRNLQVLQQLEFFSQKAPQLMAVQPAHEVIVESDSGEDSGEPQQAETLVSEAATETSSATSEPESVDSRVTQLEQSLGEQIKALSEQLNAMKAANKSAQVSPIVEPAAVAAEPLVIPAKPKRRALFDW